jgi:hypothetical protein
VLERAASSQLLQGDMDKILHAAGMSSKGKGRAAESTKPASKKLLVLHVQELQGLAMATNDHVYEPRYVNILTTMLSCLYLIIIPVGPSKFASFKYKYKY